MVEWACPCCTLINPPQLESCELCGALREDEAPCSVVSDQADAARPQSSPERNEAQAAGGESPKRQEASPDTAPPPQQELKLLSMNAWFDPVKQAKRLDAIVSLVYAHEPDAVFLQELTPAMFDYVDPTLECLGYRTPCRASTHYGEAIFLRAALPIVSYEQLPFARTAMGRSLHVLVTRLAGVGEVTLATSHLESCAEYRAVRLEQLEWSMRTLSGLRHPWVFGGDTNLGKKDQVKLPDGVSDAWEATGSDAAQQYTWDTMINKNLKPKFNAKCRFDRFFAHRVTPLTFELIGKTKVPGLDLYPSDHWGILSTFALDSAHGGKRSST